jgi:serine/threonine protein kinase/formylglycine-generating enzyme required for sulfatase activity
MTQAELQHCQETTIGPSRMNSLPRTSALRPILEDFADLWANSNAPPDVFAFLAARGEVSDSEVVDVCVLDLSRRWDAGAGLAVERYFERLDKVRWDASSRLALIVREFHCRRDRGLAPRIDDFVARFPELALPLCARLKAAQDAGPQAPNAVTLIVPSGVTKSAPVDNVKAVPNESPPVPARIGRYRLDSILGEGGFGRVYLGYDDVLKRPVAIKVPRRHRKPGINGEDTYLKEARIVASLDHPAIVPVLDCGFAEDGSCFVVSKYIEGSDLATKARRTPLSLAASAELIATVAEALHSAHLKGVVHRDIKPANILIDVRGYPFVADFGIALNEEDYGRDSATMGTILYMSPEQIRGEGHLVDGRSDIFSLGIVFYELLTGRRPFASVRPPGTLAIDPRPPRQINDGIPRELERICLKAMSNRVVDRYSTAADLAAELRLFLTPGDAPGVAVPPITDPPHKETSGPLTGESPIRIVPKGLRSFDRDDASFFLELVPGPRDRLGIPDSVHFWKTRIEESGTAGTFRVGMIYGPSGSGKSSFLKAGVIPLLSESTQTLYIESTPHGTDARLLNALRRACPDLSPEWGLADSLSAVRRRLVVTPRKLLIVLDQFEQWLHARRTEPTGELIEALRQCDGTRLQCIVTVRDDFWMAATHFMGELEIPLVLGENVAAVDLWSPRHAKLVLTAMGQAYGELPATGADITAEQKKFIKNAIAELAHNDRVVPVQLALFAQMVKDRAWIPATLKELGGAQGVGTTFLEETFNGPSASPAHRLHQRAARAVLGALLSDQSRNMKGSMRSYHELLEVSGYAQRPKEFDALLGLLNSELRLITPIDPEGLETAATTGDESTSNTERYFHLTHDYLVPSLRDWLTRKQKETRRGRAELLLAARSADWALHPTVRSLPSFFEWSSILLFAPPNARKNPRQHRNVLAAAGRYFGTRILVGAILIGLLAWGAFEWRGANSAAAYVHSLSTARIEDVPSLIQKLEPYRRWADPPLREMFAASSDDSSKRLRAALALLPVDDRFADELSTRLIQAEPNEFSVICDALQNATDSQGLAGRLWNNAADLSQATSARFRAGAALARLSATEPMPKFVDWKRVAPLLSSELVASAEVDPASYEMWLRHLRPIHSELIPELTKIFHDAKRSPFQQNLSASVICGFVDEGDPLLAELGVDATPPQIARILPKLQTKKGPISDRLHEMVSAPGPVAPEEEARDRWARRRAHAAALLLELEDAGPAWNLLHGDADPRVATYLIARLAECGVKPALLLARLQQEENPSVRASLILALGSYPPDSIPGEPLARVQQQVSQYCQEDPNCTVHSAGEWALRSWKMADKVALLRSEAAKVGRREGYGWYASPEGSTFAVFPGPVDARLGSPANESGRDSDESLTTRHIARTFAISTTEITTGQYLRFQPRFRHSNEHAPQGDCPINAVTWFDAARYCRWLSEQEHVPEDQMCFPPINKIKPGMALPDKVLARTGYRLPTEDEWEYACRAGTSTVRFYGHDTAQLGAYAWYYSNADERSWPVGSLKPNAFGLFDMLGNVSEWCFNVYVRDFAAEADGALNRRVIDRQSMVERGGGYSTSVRTIRSANRRYNLPSNSSFSIGFRIARTLEANPRPR